MEFFKVFLICSIAGFCESCPFNCLCANNLAECYINSCEDELDGSSLMLVIHGKLCANHRNLLEQMYENFDLSIRLEDDLCQGLSGCRCVIFPNETSLHM